MTSKPKIRTEQLSEETQKLFAVLNKETDLAAILISTSFIDACLRSILENKLIESKVTSKLLEHRGALGSLSARADLCYALGIISKGWYKDICTLGSLRNIVAHHHLNQNFETPEIAEQCAKLSVPRVAVIEGMKTSGRTRFTICVVFLSNWLLIKALEIKGAGKIVRPTEPKVIYGTVTS